MTIAVSVPSVRHAPPNWTGYGLTAVIRLVAGLDLLEGCLDGVGASAREDPFVPPDELIGEDRVADQGAGPETCPLWRPRDWGFRCDPLNVKEPRRAATAAPMALSWTSMTVSESPVKTVT